MLEAIVLVNTLVQVVVDMVELELTVVPHKVTLAVLEDLEQHY
jgi:hypothetical protein